MSPQNFNSTGIKMKKQTQFNQYHNNGNTNEIKRMFQLLSKQISIIKSTTQKIYEELNIFSLIFLKNGQYQTKKNQRQISGLYYTPSSILANPTDQNNQHLHEKQIKDNQIVLNQIVTSNQQQFQYRYKTTIEQKLSQNKQYLKQCKLLPSQMRINLQKQFQNKKKHFSKSKLLYRFKDNSFKKFHQHFDGMDNLIAIIKTKNNNILTGFTTLCFKKRVLPEQNQLSFICNLNKKRYYYPKNQYKTLCYDQRYLIFGNSQIRIKKDQNILYSNFATSRSFFNSNSDQIYDFLWDSNQQITQREVQIQSYEIYQLSQIQ